MPLFLQIFVPRADSVSRLKLTKADFENHVVIPMEKAGHFTSVNGKVMIRSCHTLHIGHMPHTTL